jgi:O-antigen/teichoic acid export membrane protein
VQKKLPVLQHIVNHLGVAVASKFIYLASILLYSRYMSVHDYGVINIFTSYLWLFVIGMSLNLYTGIGRYIYTEKADVGGFLGTSLLAIGAVYLAVAFAVVLRLDSISELLALPSQAILLMLAVVLGQIAESMFTQVAVFYQQSARLLKVVVSKSLATFVMSMGLLLAAGGDKFYAVFLADAVVSLVLVGYVLRSLKNSIRWSFSVKHLRYMAGYSIPLIPYMIGLVLLSQFDRIMIDRHFGKEATGLYSLTYNIGMLLPMVVTAVLNTFNPAFFAALNRGDYAEVRQDSCRIFALATLGAGVLVLFGEVLTSLVVPEKYASAFDLIPVVAVAGLCSVIFQVWARVISYANRTHLTSLIAIVATAVNIGLNYWLLPVYGYKIAAVTTGVSYLVMSLLCVVVVNYAIGVIKVNVLPDLMTVTGLAVIVIFFRVVNLPAAADIVLRGVIMGLLIWWLKDKVIALVRSRNPGVAAGQSS